MLSIIAAVAKNNALGKDNKLLWHLSKDLQRFKRITSGHVMVMGRKTYESLKRPLPNRHHIVITRNPEYNVPYANVEVVHSVDEFLQRLDPSQEYFVIGGGEIYRQLLPYSEKLYLTIVESEFEADTFFPKLDMGEFEVIEDVCEDDRVSPWKYRYVTLKRI